MIGVQGTVEAVKLALEADPFCIASWRGFDVDGIARAAIAAMPTSADQVSFVEEIARMNLSSECDPEHYVDDSEETLDWIIGRAREIDGATPTLAPSDQAGLVAGRWVNNTKICEKHGPYYGEWACPTCDAQADIVLIEALCSALADASGMIESAMKDTNWSPVPWHEDSPCVEFEALIARAKATAPTLTAGEGGGDEAR